MVPRRTDHPVHMTDTATTSDDTGGHQSGLFSLAEIPKVETATALLTDRFLVPPFTVLDARQGYWQDRKRSWLSLGIRGEVGRVHNTTERGGGTPRPNKSIPGGASGMDPSYYAKKRAAETIVGRVLSNEEFEADHWDGVMMPPTSVFDPVICEVAYRWFAPPGGRILDPFAGGSVRGVVASILGHPYTGIDLRAEQIDANNAQATEILASDTTDYPRPRWTVGNSDVVLDECPPESFDFVFSCPPYYDLEVYSDDPGDLSNMGTYDAFADAHSRIIGKAMRALKPNRFAVWVIGDIRDRAGNLRNMIADTYFAFTNADGVNYHNDAIYITPIGTMAARAASTFSGGRRLTRGHQYVMVFVKGDAKAAVAACGDLSVPDAAEMFG